MKEKNFLHELRTFFSAMLIMCLAVLMAGTVCAEETTVVTDGMGRQVTVPKVVKRVICSGPGCLRYLTYLRKQDSIVAVDSIEKRKSRFDARPYAIANRQFRNYPLFGEFRGHDNPELIVSLQPQPQVIFKTYGESGYDPVELQKRTGISVVVLNYGNLADRRDEMYGSLRLMGKVMGGERRAEEVVAFFDEAIADLNARTADVPESHRRSCYVGGIAYAGPHGFQSTEPMYPPFLFTNSRNVVYDSAKKSGKLKHADVAKEKILEWDPQFLFVDLSTITSKGRNSALYELQRDGAYSSLTAVREGRAYGVLPYNWYTQNHGSILADSYYVGKILYPERFEDIDPEEKANSIYAFLVGKAVYGEMDDAFGNLAFKKLPLEENMRGK